MHYMATRTSFEIQTQEKSNSSKCLIKINVAYVIAVLGKSVISVIYSSGSGIMLWEMFYLAHFGLANTNKLLNATAYLSIVADLVYHFMATMDSLLI